MKFYLVTAFVKTGLVCKASMYAVSAFSRGFCSPLSLLKLIFFIFPTDSGCILQMRSWVICKDSVHSLFWPLMGADMLLLGKSRKYPYLVCLLNHHRFVTTKIVMFRINLFGQPWQWKLVGETVETAWKNLYFVYVSPRSFERQICLSS